MAAADSHASALGFVAFAALFFSFSIATATTVRADEPADPVDDEEKRPGLAERSADPSAIPGGRIVYHARPALTPDVRACSTRTPVCVHATAKSDGPAVLATLAAFERGWLTLTGALEAPAPDIDPMTLAYDVFLVDGLADRAPGDVARTELESRDVRSRFDRGRAFSVVDRRVRAGCELDTLAARAVARASLFRVAPATEDGTARAQAAYLAELATPCAVGRSVAEVAAFQALPHAAFVNAHVSDRSVNPAEPGPPSRADALFSDGAAAFWARLDWAFGRRPGGVVTAAWALHPTITTPAALRWNNRPDTFDVLRASFKGALSTGSTVHDLWLDFGVARAFVGSADDGLHIPELRTVGPAGAIAPDWDIPWPKSPRRLAARAPVEPTGASYLTIRRAGTSSGAGARARLRAEIEWEEHALFRWVFVKVAANGAELGRVVIPTTERATTAQMTLVDLDAVDRVILVGTNVGDPAYAFDPDDAVWEPHGWLVTLAEED